MSKSLFLILIIVSLIFCVPRIRETNYDEEKLKDCLSKISINLDEKVEELRTYHDSNREFIFRNKFTEYGFNADKKEEMIKCFEQFGLKVKRVTPFLDCMDRCKIFREKGGKCSCPHY